MLCSEWYPRGRCWSIFCVLTFYGNFMMIFCSSNYQDLVLMLHRSMVIEYNGNWLMYILLVSKLMKDFCMSLLLWIKLFANTKNGWDMLWLFACDCMLLVWLRFMVVMLSSHTVSITCLIGAWHIQELNEIQLNF